MKLHVLGCSGGQLPGHQLSSYLIDGSLLIDAGSASAVLRLREQQKIENILITHTHLDHVMSLAMLADNLYSKRDTSISVWGTEEVIAGLKESFFNNTVWPDFTRITGDTQRSPVLRLRILPEGETVAVGKYTVAAVKLNHTVPSSGFFIGGDKKTLLHLGDTGPTDAVWSAARQYQELCAVVIETSFPNRLQEVADASRHLTPRTLAGEMEKLARPSVPVLVTHLKPEYRKEIVSSLKKLKGYRLRVLNDADVLRF